MSLFEDQPIGGSGSVVNSLVRISVTFCQWVGDSFDGASLPRERGAKHWSLAGRLPILRSSAPKYTQKDWPLDDRSPPTQRKHIVPLLILGCVALGLAYMFRGALSFEALSENRTRLLEFRDAHYSLSVLSFVAAYTVIVGFSLPGATVATLAGGFLFSTFPGVVFNIIGATLGASALFLAARWGFGDWLSSKLDASEGRIHKIKRGIDDNQWSMLFLMRFTPVVPFFLANLLPALLGVAFHRFVISTALGIIPGALILTSVGAGLGTVFDQGAYPDFGILFEPKVFLPILGLCLLAIAPMLLKMRRKER